MVEKSAATKVEACSEGGCECSGGEGHPRICESVVKRVSNAREGRAGKSVEGGKKTRVVRGSRSAVVANRSTERTLAADDEIRCITCAGEGAHRHDLRVGLGSCKGQAKGEDSEGCFHGGD